MIAAVFVIFFFRLQELNFYGFGAQDLFVQIAGVCLCEEISRHESVPLCRSSSFSGMKLEGKECSRCVIIKIR
jgi:hypothetical protein